jgi:DNA-directed RNA polymerase subunit RPC12/RpoP
MQIHEDVSDTIVSQMGGMGKLKAMLGAKVGKVPNGIAIRWPNKQASRGNYVEVVLNGQDLYDMTFFSIRAGEKKEVKRYPGVANDQLISTFEQQSGWYLSLGGRTEEARDPKAAKSSGLGYKCLECGKKFKTTKAAENAVNNGCPKCGGSDIDLDTGKSEGLRVLTTQLRAMVEAASGEKFRALEKELSKRADVRNPAALAAWIGRQKYGAKGMAKKSAAGK